VLLDTGPLVAVLDAADQWHDRCAAAWLDLADRCLTTEAVITEASHLVARGGALAALPLEFLLSVGIPIVAIESSGHEHAVRLMNRYGSVPMDYADATLVVVADALKLDTVLTTDRRGFRTYRRSSGATFVLTP
jgi:predicted nucleic acid-binding protein